VPGGYDGYSHVVIKPAGSLAAAGLIKGKKLGIPV